MTAGAPLSLCFLGNSHIAALRSAWTEGRDRWPGLNARFVGAHKGLLLETAVTDGWLRPTSDDAKTAFARLGGGQGVRLADYDAIVITGCLVALSLTASVYRRMHWVGLPSVADHPDLANASQLLVSADAARATVEDSLAQRLGPRLIAHLRPHTNRPILLTSQPRARQSVQSSKDATTKAHRIALAAGDGAALSDLHEDAARRAVEAAGGTYIAQPTETITDHILTSESFMRGATRLAAKPDAPQPADDIRHANAAYGARVLDQISQHLKRY